MENNSKQKTPDKISNAFLEQRNCSSEKVVDQVKEISVSSSAKDFLEEQDPERKLKVAKLKKQYEEGTLKAAASEEVAKKIIKKFNF